MTSKYGQQQVRLQQKAQCFQQPAAKPGLMFMHGLETRLQQKGTVCSAANNKLSAQNRSVVSSLLQKDNHARPSKPGCDRNYSVLQQQTSLQAKITAWSAACCQSVLINMHNPANRAATKTTVCYSSK